MRRRRAARNRPPKLLHLTTTDISLDLLLGPQLKAFGAAGFEVVGVSAPGEHVDHLATWGVRHVPLHSSTRSVSPLNDVKAAREFLGVLRREQPDIVHTHNPKPGLYGRPLARLVGTPLVVNTVHGLYAQATDPVPRRALVYALERVAAMFSDVELVQNAEDVTTLRSLRVPERRLRLLGNGIDLARFAPDAATAEQRRMLRAEWGVGDDDVVVLSVGRLVAEKGMPELIEAASGVPGVKVVIVGPEDESKADALRPADHPGVVFAGYMADVERAYAAADLFVLASHREGFPRAAMEAAAMGLAVVATDIRGCRQVVDDGVTGALFPVGDTAALRHHIRELAADAARRTTMGQRGREKALVEFDHGNQVATSLEVYRHLVPAGL